MNKLMYGIIAISFVALLGVSFVFAQGFGNGAMSGLTEEEKTEWQANKEAMRGAVESGNYEAWAEQMNERARMIQEEINPERFVEIQARHAERAEFKAAMQEARENGADKETLSQIKEDYGVTGKGFGKGMKGSGIKGLGMGNSGNYLYAESE